MYKRKYQNYRIIVSKENGQKEITDMKKYDVDTDSYKDMLNAYNEVKEEYKNQNVVIEFCGLSDNGQLDVMWSTEGFKKEPIENVENRKNKSTEEIVKDLEDIINILYKRADKTDLTDVYNKERDYLYHLFESNKKKKDLTNEEKIRVYNEMERVAVERRNEKDSKKINTVLNSHKSSMNNIKLMIKDLKDEFNGIKICHRNGEKKYSNENGLISSIKRIAYDSEKIKKVK